MAQVLELLRQPHLIERGLSFWGVAIFIQVLLGAYCFALSEIMNTTHYIESQLVSKVNKRGKSVFWGYEKYKSKNRVYSPEGMYIPVAFCIAIPYIVLYLRPVPCEVIDYLGAPLGAVAASVTFYIARVAVLAQKQFAP